jgi:DNA-binding NtrC family response regulator
MPRVDGYGVLQHIREHNPALLNCTILATAVPERDLGHSLKDSIYRIHSKPFDIQRLIEDVRHCAEIAAN